MKIVNLARSTAPAPASKHPPIVRPGLLWMYVMNPPEYGQLNCKHPPEGSPAASKFFSKASAPPSRSCGKSIFVKKLSYTYHPFVWSLRSYISRYHYRRCCFDSDHLHSMVRTKTGYNKRGKERRETAYYFRRSDSVGYPKPSPHSSHHFIYRFLLATLSNFLTGISTLFSVIGGYTWCTAQS